MNDVEPLYLSILYNENIIKTLSESAFKLRNGKSVTHVNRHLLKAGYKGRLPSNKDKVEVQVQKLSVQLTILGLYKTILMDFEDLIMDFYYSIDDRKKFTKGELQSIVFGYIEKVTDLMARLINYLPSEDKLRKVMENDVTTLYAHRAAMKISENGSQGWETTIKNIVRLLERYRLALSEPCKNNSLYKG